MSTNAGPATAKVFELRPSHLTRLVEREGREVEARPGAVLDDLADAIEAIHACANLAGFSKRARDLIFALATCVHSRTGDYVDLIDEELAELQNCDAKTVQRQRQDYLREARERRFDLIAIVEGEYDSDAKRHAPTRYKFIVGEVVDQIVTEARAREGWDTLGRMRQREGIQRAAASLYEDIPDAPPRRRKRRRPRTASAEIATCQKLIGKQLEKLREFALHLPCAEREWLLEEPGYLRTWWHEVRARMDEFCDAYSPQDNEPSRVGAVGGQIVHPPPDEETAVREVHPEDSAAWDKLEERVSAPPIRSVEVALRPPESVPRDLSCESEGEGPDPLSVEELEAEAVRAEACGWRAPW